MAIIQNIPENMITEHVNWHTRPGNPGGGGRAINPWPGGSTEAALGSGEEFLVWHQGYVARFREWVDSLPGTQKPDASAIQPWTAIPQGLKMGMVGWNASRAEDEARLSDMSSFETLDDLGRFLEWGLHGFLHGASTQMWNEPVLSTFESPRSTYFWQLHGLIEHWRQQWVDAQQQAPGLRIDPGLLRELLRILRRPPRIPRPWPPRPPFPVPPFPQPWPWPGPGPDPLPFDPDEVELVNVFRRLRVQR